MKLACQHECQQSYYCVRNRNLINAMRKIIFCTLLTGLLHTSFAQNNKPAASVSNLAKFDIGLQGLGLSYEQKLANKFSIDLAAGAGGAYDISEVSLNYNIDFSQPAFYFSITPKYFYNIEKRASKGKSTLLNSGNYIGLRLKYVTPNDTESDATRNSILVNVHWGVQAALGNHFLFNAHAGIGYGEDIDYHFGTIYPALDFKFAYVFFKGAR